jgi:two-component system response regulator BaeR
MSTNAASRVLVVEDERKISDLLLNYLRAEGYEATPVYDGCDAVQQIAQRAPDVVVLDWMLPGLDGIGVCKAVRAFSDVPILMLTARVDELDRLLGLDIGADDYVCKPFGPREVVARVRALLRRASGRVIALPQPWLVEEASFRIS